MVTVGLASHRPCLIDNSGIPTYGCMGSYFTYLLTYSLTESATPSLGCHLTSVTRSQLGVWLSGVMLRALDVPSTGPVWAHILLTYLLTNGHRKGDEHHISTPAEVWSLFTMQLMLDDTRVFYDNILDCRRLDALPYAHPTVSKALKAKKVQLIHNHNNRHPTTLLPG